MMRITQKQGDETTTLIIEGSLTGVWVEELRKVWDEIVAQTPASLVRIDLTEVTTIDVVGKKLLADMFASGATAGPANVMTRAIVEQILCHTQLRRSQLHLVTK